MFCSALKKFREAFTCLSKSEKVFNPQHLLRAFSLYDEKFDSWSWDQRDLFVRQVIGFLQRFLPANIAQVFVYGFYDIMENKHAIPDHFNFRFNPAYHIFPGSHSCDGLGFDFMARAAGSPGWRYVAGWAANAVAFFTKLMSRKNSMLSELYAASARAVTNDGTRLRSSVA